MDESFPIVQFHMQGYSSPFSLDRNICGGGLLLCLWGDIPAKLINNIKFEKGIEAVFMEINLKKKKWLVNVSYNPHKLLIEKHLKAIGRNLDLPDFSFRTVCLQTHTLAHT